MSIHVINLVMQRFPGKGNEYGVMLALAENAHDDGSSIHPGLDEIARKARVSRNTARRMRDRLVEKGWLNLEYQGGNGPRDPNRYRMDVDRLQACPKWEVESQNKGTNLDPLPDAKGTTQVGPIKDPNLTPLEDAKGPKSGSKGTKALVPEPSLEPSVRSLTNSRANSHITSTDVFELFQRRGVKAFPGNANQTKVVVEMLHAGAMLEDIDEAISRAYETLEGSGNTFGPAYLRPRVMENVNKRGGGHEDVARGGYQLDSGLEDKDYRMGATDLSGYTPPWEQQESVDEQ